MSQFPKRIRDISFWYYHTAGWLLYVFMQLSLFMSWNGVQFPALYSISLQLIVMYFVFFILRRYYTTLPFETMGLFPLIIRMVISSFVLTLLWFCIWGGIEYSFFAKKFLKYISTPLAVVSRLSYFFPIFLGWSALYFGIKTWRNWLEQRDQAEQAMEQAQHSQLQMLRYQLNPHFLFNALNSVRALVDEDARGAKTMITELSDFLRYSLVSRNKPIVTLKEELDAIGLYLSIEQQRYEDKLQVHYSIDKLTEDIQVPSFLIHPLVEEALRIGMQTSSMPLRLEIQSSLNNGTLTIAINHSGSHLPGNGNGSNEPALEQVEARLKELFPGQFRLFTLQQKNQAQTILELMITTGIQHEKEIASHSR